MLSRSRRAAYWLFIVAVSAIAVAVFATPSNIREHDLLIGVYQPNNPGSYNQVDAFSQVAGFDPRILSYYSTFTQPFATAFANQATAKGAMTLVQWQPRGTTNSAIASGATDTYIRQFADAIKASNGQVIVSYGQEMNGNWYDWGQPDSPSNYVAAYKHIHELFQQEGVYNVTWLWDPNVLYTGSTSFSELYPGDEYVDWVGLDGYFAKPTDTFQTLFGPSIQVLRTITHKPLLIAESGVTGVAGSEQLTSLFEGASLAGALGIVYFDEAQTGDSEHQNWRLENNAANMATFSILVQQYAERPLTWNKD